MSLVLPGRTYPLEVPFRKPTKQSRPFESEGDGTKNCLRLAEREERDQTYFGLLRHEREKKLRDLQDVLIEADRLRQQLKKRRAQRRGTPQQ